MRALISVSDKTGVVEFAKELEALGVEIISTGGTHKVLEEAGVKVTGISDVTGFPECLDGRVKTLHPKVHGALLARRDVPEHMAQLKELGIETIDIVAINLYPFKATIMKPDVTLADAIENIDIGGPTMLRSSAKNHKDVTVVCDPADYGMVIEALKNGGTTYEQRYELALKVFRTTAAYDAMISEYLRKQIDAPYGDDLTLTFEKVQDLRYGENPHQKATYYKEIQPWEGSLVTAEQLHGKELSFNNINDTQGALATLKEFEEPTVVAVKHANPCGVGTADNLYDAYVKAYECDPVSIFGGIVACNRPVDKKTAEEMSKIFMEILIAPDFDEDALEVLKQKKNLRIMKLPNSTAQPPEDEGHNAHHRHQREGDQRQADVQRQHHRREAHDADRVLEEAHQDVGEDVVHRVHVVGQAGDDLAHGRDVEEAHRQALHVGEEVVADALDDLLARALHQPEHRAVAQEQAHQGA